ncbi:hypothetical protein FOZ60_002527 [Perkinsus olseni]|uniref:Integrase catalytic domain-containing protein n=1 Tax=Perkinsus olseni TaxID=32597 RepID=A0A7J6NXP1_PEROL|nr:hypothetical protein FOZ60_002527 [Perkinsus olseni]
MTTGPDIETPDDDGAPSRKRFAFLKDTVIKELDKENEFVDSSEALSERSLRRLENVSLAVQNMVGLTSFCVYGSLPGLSFRGPNDKLLQLSPSAFCKAWNHAHDAVGHLVPLQMKNRLSRWVYWPGMLSDCEAFTRHCLGCDRERARHTPGSGYRESVATRRFEVLYIDFAGPVSGWTYTDPSSGTVLHGCSVLLMVDGCSNYTELAVASDQTVPTVVRLLLDRWVLRYGVPLIVRSDRGHSFCSKVLRLLYAKLQISFVPSSGITPQSQGQIEVIVRALKRHLERLLTSDLSVIPLVQRVINTTIRYVTSGSETVFTPELMLYHDDLHASDDPVAITDRVRNAVNTFTEGWCSEVAERRAKSVDALNQRSSLIYRVIRDGLGRSKSLGPYIVREVLPDRLAVTVYGIDEPLPLHQVRKCNASLTSQGLSMQLTLPDPHHLLSKPRSQLEEGNVIMFITVEWCEAQVETYFYDLGNRCEEPATRVAPLGASLTVGRTRSMV